MPNGIRVASILLVLVLTGYIAFAIKHIRQSPVLAPETEIAAPALSHAQEIWMRNLEMCESSGDEWAVNEEDLDGTPSYGAFQFKIDTFWYFAEKYDAEPLYAASAIDEVDHPGERFFWYRRDNQVVVLTQMLLHKNEIEWEKQFPGCVAKIGAPPA